MLPEIGLAGQETLKAARVLIVGVGGLGCPAALYLAAVGVGHLTLLDHDRVALSNLHRQVLFGIMDIGESKAFQARKRLEGSAANVVAIAEALSPDNAEELVAGHDYVLDCSDNFRTRYLLSDACAIAGKPLLTAAISRFDAEIALLCDADLPCYRCLFPEPAVGKIQNCADAGVLGSFVGIVGTMQAHETVKAILGLSRIRGRLLCYQGMDNEISHYGIDRNPDCLCCSDRRKFSASPGHGRWPLPLPDDFCRMASPSRTIQAHELADALTDSCLLIDVREPSEYRSQHIRGAQNFALADLSALPEAWKQKDLIIYCLSGLRSQKALAFLGERGFSRLAHLEGGIRSLHSSGLVQLLTVSS
jgi:adenylyltransferase/sulfurtransferase